MNKGDQVKAKLGDVVQLEQGLAINKKSKYLLVDEGLPLLRITDMIHQNFTQFIDPERVPNKFIVKNDDIIYSRTGQVGLVFRKQYGVIHNNCFRVIPDKKVDRGYLFWYLKTEIVRHTAGLLAGGAAQPDLNHDAFKSILFTYPKSVEKQKIIASIFDSYDAAIENNNRRIQILETIAQKLYQEWFVHYRFPNHEQAQWQETEQGKIPMGWEKVQFNDLVESVRDNIRKGALNEPTPYIGLEHLPRKSIALSDWLNVDEIGSSKLRFQKYDILFGKIRPYFHKVGAAQTSGICSSDTFVWRVKEPEYFGIALNVAFSDDFVAHSNQTSQGTKMPRANWDVLKEYPVVIPEKRLLLRFNRIVQVLVDQIIVLSKKNKNLKQQRDMLLPKLIER